MFDFSEYGFSEEASLEANDWIESTEWLDFVACMRSDGSVYGTGGRCRSGREISLQPGEGMPRAASKARKAGMKQGRVKEIADAVRAKYGGKQVRGDALASVVRRINEDLKKGGGDENKAAKELSKRWKEYQQAQKDKSAKKEEKKEGLDAALKKAEAEASKVKKSSGAGKGLTADVGRKFPRKDENAAKHFEDKERARGRLDAKFLAGLNERQLKRLAKEASLNEGQKKKIADEIEKRGATAPSAVKRAAAGVQFQKQPGGGLTVTGADGQRVAYINKGVGGYRVYDAKNGELLNKFKDLNGAKNYIKNRTERLAKEAKQEDKQLANAPKNVKEMALAYREGKTLGKGVMGEVRLNAGPPPSVIKKGEVGENEAAALKKLERTGVAPKLLGNTGVKDAKEVEMQLGGHVNAGKGMIQMSEASGKPSWPYGERPEVAAARLDSLMEARAKMHMAGVAHNDMHPGNVFYDPATKKSQIVDFGLAQIGPKFALAEALGTNRDEDYQSQDHFENTGGLKASSRYQRFEANREKLLKKLKYENRDAPGIRNRMEDQPEWLQNMSDAQAEKYVKELYDGV